MYPGALPLAGTANPADTLAAAGHTALHNSHSNEARAIATKVGTGSSTPASGLLLRGNGAGTSAWSQVGLTSDVSGVLPTANGGSGNANLSFPAGAETVVGRAVSETLSNKTLTTPTIASFINALHDHTNSAGGGTLGASTVGSSQIVDNSIAFGDLLSTIFSGQVLTQTNAGTAGGTIWYVNLGGIKLAWCQTAAFATSTATTNVTITWPTSFFSTMQAVIGTVNGVGTIGTQFFTGNNGTSGAGTTTTYTFYVFTTTGSGTANVNALAIGT